MFIEFFVGNLHMQSLTVDFSLPRSLLLWRNLQHNRTLVPSMTISCCPLWTWCIFVYCHIRWTCLYLLSWIAYLSETQEIAIGGSSSCTHYPCSPFIFSTHRTQNYGSLSSSTMFDRPRRPSSWKPPFTFPLIQHALFISWWLWTLILWRLQIVNTADTLLAIFICNPWSLMASIFLEVFIFILGK